MTTTRHLWLLAAALTASMAATPDAAAQTDDDDDGRTPSASQALQPQRRADVTLPFAIGAEGQRYSPTWGLDLQWINEQNLRKGLRHMGPENVGIGRTGFRTTKALVNDSVLSTDQTSYLRQRSQLFDIVSPTLPLVLTADQEAGSDTYFVKNKVCDVDHWAANINSHVHWMQQNTQHPIVGVSPFNEPDYWTTEEGASVQRQVQVAQRLKEQYPRLQDVAIVGGNTLNDDKALEWYTSGKQYYDWGNTHQLAGSFDSFAGFFRQLQQDGKVGYADEMHNVGEAMIGLEYGMTVGVWWGFDSRARGEFCDISRHGVRLAYGEHRTNWTAASVYRHDDGRVKAFLGSSERQALTTTYQLLSRDREVYYDGRGPLRELCVEMPGGTGYQKGQTNAERVIDITWGDDVPPCAITEGTYKLVNKATGNALAASAGNIVQQKYTGTQTQQWNVKPVSARIGGDFSFYELTSASNDKLRPNVENFSTLDGANVIAYAQNDTPDSNEQWYLEYAGDGYYRIRCRETSLYLSSASSYAINGVNVVTKELLTADNTAARQLWRLLPPDVTYETDAPQTPTGLQAEALTAAVRLTWDANSDATDAYMVLRAEAGTDAWNTIARQLTATAYVDNTCRPGRAYIYKVKAIDRAQNTSQPSASVEAAPTATPALTAHWTMDGTLQDATANEQDAAAYGNVTYVAGHDGDGGQAAMLTTATYMQLPYEVASTDELTVCLWVYWRAATAWQRLFDFGNGTDQYLFLTPNNGNIMRFAIKNGGDEQTVDCASRLPMNQWKHVAVAIGRDRTTIYVDGQPAASSTGVTIRPSDICPALNYVGRSQFVADPFLSAYVDDVRVYNYALSDDQVAAIAAGTADAIDGPTADATRQPAAIYSLDGRRLSAPQRGINIVSGRKVAGCQ